MPQEPTKSITFIGREWFRKSAGNSYQSCEILVNGKAVTKIQCGCVYGDHYTYTGMDWLNENGYLPVPRQHTEAPFRYCEDNGITLEYRKFSVSRERDL